jgi:hypothetical protein
MKKVLVPVVIGILLQSLHVGGFSLAGPPRISARSTNSKFMGRTMTLNTNTYRRHEHYNRKGSQMNMFLGTDSGILGVGAPEIVSRYFDYICNTPIIYKRINYLSF